MSLRAVATAAVTYGNSGMQQSGYVSNLEDRTEVTTISAFVSHMGDAIVFDGRAITRHEVAQLACCRQDGRRGLRQMPGFGAMGDTASIRGNIAVSSCSASLISSKTSSS